MIDMEEKLLNKALYELAGELKKKSVLEASDSFVFDSSGFRAKASDYPVWELLKRLENKGVLAFEPNRHNVIDSPLMLTGFKHPSDTRTYKIELSNNFSNYIEDLRQQFESFELKLDKDVNDLLLMSGNDTYKIHSFKTKSSQDSLLDYLLMNPNEELGFDSLKEGDADERVLFDTSKPGVNKYLNNMKIYKDILKEFIKADKNTIYLKNPIKVQYKEYTRIIAAAEKAHSKSTKIHRSS